MTELEEQGDTGNWKTFKWSRNSIKAYNPNVSFTEITPDWISKYKQWLNRERTLSETTHNFYLKSLRACFNRAIETHIIKRDLYPFGKGLTAGKKNIKIRRTERRNIALEQKEIDRIIEMSSRDPKIQFALDFFSLSYQLCGINMADIANLKQKEIIGLDLKKMAAGKLKPADLIEVYRKREKTKRTSGEDLQIPFTAMMKKNIFAIIQRRGNFEAVHPEDYVFNILKPGLSIFQIDDRIHDFVKDINKPLRKVREHLKLNQKITTYVARHTFARVHLQTGGTVEELQVLFGHADISTTMNYCKYWMSAARKTQGFERMESGRTKTKKGKVVTMKPAAEVKLKIVK